MSSTRPKIGIALSGGSGRSIAHIGVLEVLREQNIPIDYITACSSATMVAASFACGTVEELKRDWLKVDAKFLLNLFKLDKSGKGILNIDKGADWFRKYTAGKKFEDVLPRLGFVCADITTGEPVLLALGDLVRAGQASCATPGLFEPVEWGNRLLVDGGLFSIVPGREAREMGADIVIGVDIAATRQVIRKRYLYVWRGYNFLRRSPIFRLIGSFFNLLNRVYESSMKVVFYNQSDFVEEEVLKNPNFLTVLSRSMELVEQAHRQGLLDHSCDIILSPNVKNYGKVDFASGKYFLEEGRRATLEALPEIQKLLREYGWRKKNGFMLKRKAVSEQRA